MLVTSTMISQSKVNLSIRAEISFASYHQNQFRFIIFDRSVFAHWTLWVLKKFRIINQLYLSQKIFLTIFNKLSEVSEFRKASEINVSSFVEYLTPIFIETKYFTSLVLLGCLDMCIISILSCVVLELMLNFDRK